MKVLIAGGRGQLGTDLTKILISNNIETFFYDSSELDITDINSIFKKINSASPDIIINCAAYTNVDNCESDIEKAFKVNALGAKHCAIAAETFNKKLIHISTDYVFNGKKKSPYTEYDKPEPLSVYANSKLHGEFLIKEHCKKFFILRVAGVYGIYGNNFVKTIIQYGKTKDMLKVVNDQITTPTYTIDIANQILQLIDSEFYGTYHATAEGECSWYEFTSFIFGKLNIRTKIIPCTTEEFPRPARRPSYSVLDNFNLKLINKNFMRHWKDGINDFLKKHFQV